MDGGMPLARAFVQLTMPLGTFNIEAGNVRRTLAALDARVAATTSRLGALLMGGGVVGLAYGLYKSVTAASHLNEVLNFVRVQFGKDAQTIIDFATRMNQEFGLSKTQLMEAAAGFGTLAEGAGMAQATTARFATDMTRLAADLASLRDIPLAAAVEKIQSGLAGQVRPMREVGVFLSAAAVKAEAFRMGLAKSTAEMTDQVKFQARLSLIQSGLAKASGDLARTANDPANAWRRFAGQMETLGAEIGTALMPAVKDLMALLLEMVQAVRDSFAGAEEGVGGFVKGIQEGIATAAAVFRNFDDIVALVGVDLAEWVDKGAADLEYVGGVISAVADAFRADWMGALRMVFEAMKTMVLNVIENIKNAWGILFDYVKSGFQEMREFQAKGLLEGFDAAAHGLKLPERRAVDYSAQREAIVERMNKTEAAHAEKMAKKPAEAEKAGKYQFNAPEGKSEKYKAAFTDLPEFSKQLTTGILGGNVEKDQLKELREIKAAIKGTGKDVGEAAAKAAAGMVV